MRRHTWFRPRGPRCRRRPARPMWSGTPWPTCPRREASSSTRSLTRPCSCTRMKMRPTPWPRNPGVWWRRSSDKRTSFLACWWQNARIVSAVWQCFKSFSQERLIRQKELGPMFSLKNEDWTISSGTPIWRIFLFSSWRTNPHLLSILTFQLNGLEARIHLSAGSLGSKF